MKHSIYLSISFVVLIYSCKKNNHSSTGGQSRNNIVRIQKFSGGVDTGSTVFLLKYNSSDNIISITDSVHGNGFIGNYDSYGNLIKVTADNGDGTFDSVVYTYKDGLMTSAKYDYLGTGGIARFFYNNGTIYLDSLTGGYSTYEVVNGNVTKVTQYINGGGDAGGNTYTFNDKPNIFKQLSLFNWYDGLGNIEVADRRSVFNKNQVITYTDAGSLSATSTYTYDSLDRPIKVVTSDTYAGPYYSTITWLLSYN